MSSYWIKRTLATLITGRPVLELAIKPSLLQIPVIKGTCQRLELAYRLVSQIGLDEDQSSSIRGPAKDLVSCLRNGHASELAGAAAEAACTAATFCWFRGLACARGKCHTGILQQASP